MTTKHEQGIEAAAKAVQASSGDAKRLGIAWCERVARVAATAYLSTVLDETELAEVIARAYESDAPRLQEVNRHDIRAARAVISHLRGGNDE